jgi:hypothetical protein
VFSASVATAQMFNVANSNSALRSLGFTAAVTQTSGSLWITLAGARTVLEDFACTGDFTAVEVTSSGRVLSGIFSSGASGGSRIIMLCGNTNPILSTLLFNLQSAPYPNIGINLQHCSGLLADKIYSVTQGTGLQIGPNTGQICSTNTFMNCLFENAGTGGCVNIGPANSGVATNNKFVGVGATSNSGGPGFSI